MKDKNNNFKQKHLTILLKQHKEYWNKDKNQWEIPSIVMKNILAKSWNLGKSLREK